MTFRFALPLALASIVALAPRSVRGSPNDDLQALLNESIVTTASKDSESSSIAPAMSSTLTAEDIRQYGIHSVDDAINFLSLGMMTSNSPLDVEVGARGLILTQDQADHVLLLINGHSVNEPLFGSARFGRGAGIPMEIVDRIELILGPGSVLYGSSAMLGVVNIVTKRAKDFAGGHVIAETEVKKSYRFGAAAGYEIPFFGRKLDLTVALEYYTQSGPSLNFPLQNVGNDLLDGLPIQFSTSGPATGIWGGKSTKAYYSEVPAAFIKAVVGDFQLMAHALTFERAAPYNSPLTPTVALFDDPAGYQLDRRLVIDLSYQRSLSTVFELKARGYGDGFDYQQYADVADFTGCLNSTLSTCRFANRGLAMWAGSELQLTADWLGNGNLVTLLGVDGRVRKVKFQADISDEATGAPLLSSRGVLNHTDATLGAYVQQVWHANPRLHFNGGMRLDIDPRFAPVLSPRLTASTRLWKGSTLKAIYSQAFRAPSWAETSAETFTQVLSTNLVPEVVHSAELSLEQSVKSQRVVFGLFGSWWNNLVSSHQLSIAEAFEFTQDSQITDGAVGTLTQYRNLTSVFNGGFNASIDGSAFNHRLRYGIDASGTLARATANGSQTPVPVSPRVYGNARILYEAGGNWPTVALAGHYLATRFAQDAIGYGVTVAGGANSSVVAQPRYRYAPTQIELRATISGGVPFLKGLTYRASANYLFANTAPYLIGPGDYFTTSSVDVRTLTPIDTFQGTLALEYNFLK